MLLLNARWYHAERLFYGGLVDDVSLGLTDGKGRGGVKFRGWNSSQGPRPDHRETAVARSDISRRRGGFTMSGIGLSVYSCFRYYTQRAGCGLTDDERWMDGPTTDGWAGVCRGCRGYCFNTLFFFPRDFVFIVVSPCIPLYVLFHVIHWCRGKLAPRRPASGVFGVQ